MKSLEQLIELQKKELELAENHRKKAADLKRQIEIYRCDTAQKKLNALNLTGQEYDRLMSLLSSGKVNVLAAADIILSDAAGNQAANITDK